MKVLLILALAALSAVGCATSKYSYGRDFPSASVAKIERGKTTAAEMKQMFGEPLSKMVVSATEEKWTYSYGSGSAHAQSYLVTMSVKTTGTQKTLDVLIGNGVVTNYAYTEGPGPAASVK